ncbi:hypothetical protein C0993_008683 [Termitomyces sp. T159_Od127]|nr:hypothetical protein C0993_008683 [Termitomyces sp. T159_Od127]
MTSTPGHPHGCKCGLATSPHTAAVPAMQKTRALCMALPIGPREELLLQLLAAKDAARAPSPDELALELAQEESSAYAPLPGLEEDF